MPVHPNPPRPPAGSASELAACGFYLVPHPGGFVLHMSVSPAHLRRLRAQVFQAVIEAGGDVSAAETAQLVISELVANVVRLCGPWAPVVVQVTSGAKGVLVKVHDPQRDTIPHGTAPPPDNAEAESGRGLWIVDLLSPGWTVERTPLGKQIVCTLPYAAQTPA